MAADAQRVQELFAAALELMGPADRAAFLEQACAEDADLRARVEALLAAHGVTDSFLDQPLVAGLTTDPLASVGTSENYSYLQPAREAGHLGRLGHYEMLEVVGQGGMGVVFRAVDEKLRRVVAVKTMAPALAAQATARQRFIREAQAAAAIAHEHVIALHGVDAEGPVPYIVMQFVEGMTLEEKLRKEGPLPVTEILRIGYQMASGLAAAHKLGLVHRDIKPSNILLENGIQRVKITDFGLARAANDGNLTQSGQIAGTPQYMSPEQAEGQPVDHRSDLFSLGSVLYAMATGQPPFQADTPLAILKRVCEQTPTPARELNPELPAWLAAIIAKLMSKQPVDRFPSAQEVADLLQQHLAHLQQPHAVPMPAPISLPADASVRTTPPKNRSRTVAVGSICLVIMLVLLGYKVAHKQIHAWVGSFFYHELTLKLPDNDTIVSLYATDDQNEQANTFSLTAMSEDLAKEPRAMVARYQEVSLHLPPGNYWLFAKRYGVNLQRKLLKIPWGGKQTLVLHDAQQVTADQARLQGHWEAVAVRYLDGPALGPEALPLTNLEVADRHLRIRLPGLDSGFDFTPVVVGTQRWLSLSGISSRNTFQVGPTLYYEFREQSLCLRLESEQPQIDSEHYRRQGLPVPVPKNKGLEIILRRQAKTPPVTDSLAQDKERLKGVWRMALQSWQGKPLGLLPLPLTFSFDGTKARLRIEPVEIIPGLKAVEENYEGVLTLETGAEPKRLAIWVPGDEKRSLLGIYRFVGDRLEICYLSEPTTPAYPTVFATTLGGKERHVLLERFRPDYMRQPLLFKLLDPVTTKPVPPPGVDPQKSVTVENGVWRIENTTGRGNFNVLLTTLLEDDLPTEGIIICRAKVKVEARHQHTWGDLQLGEADPGFHKYAWPKEKYEYHGNVPEWTEKEVRYPAAVFQRKSPPQIAVYVGLHAEGVLWVKDVELLVVLPPQNLPPTKEAKP